MSAVEAVSAAVDNQEMLRLFYATTPPDHRAIAILERDVWAAFGAATTGKKPKRDHWFRDQFGLADPTHVTFRQCILAYEPWSSPLWGVIGHRAPRGEVSLRRVYGICLALRLNLNKTEEAQRLAENPSEAILYRVNDDRAAETKTIDCSPSDVRELRDRLREAVSVAKPIALKKLENEDPSVADEIVGALDVEVQAAVTDFLTRIDRLRSQAGNKSIIEIKRRDLRRACEFLGIKLPARGGSIDMAKAKRAHRKLSAQYHPDRTNGNEQMTGQYLEVQKAWQVISGYQS